MKNTWNENMRLCRERYNYSQKELSAMLNVSERTLQRYESGMSEPTLSILLNLSKIYEISVDAIIGNEYHSHTDPTKLERYIKDIENTCSIIRHAIYDTEQ